MMKFQVDINGQNLLLDLDGKIAKYGFYTLRFVEAVDLEAAENNAVQSIRETQRLREMALNNADDPPVMDVTNILELESFDAVENREPGFVWYEEKPKQWWQFWRR